MNYILGLCIFGHDSSAALVDAQTGKILLALTEERFSNVKHDGGFPAACLDHIIKRISDKGDIKYIALNVDAEISLRKINDLMVHGIDGKINSKDVEEILSLIRDADFLDKNQYPLNYIADLLGKSNHELSNVENLIVKINWFGNFYIKNKRLIRNLKELFPLAEIWSVAHHISHAASAYYCSGFEEAAILTIDGMGEVDTITLGYGVNGNITRVSNSEYPNSIGALYTKIADHLGFLGDENNPGFGDEYKVMGMAAYGRPVYIDIFKQLGDVDSSGVFTFKKNPYLAIEPVIGCPGHEQPSFTVNFYREVAARRNPGGEIEQLHYDIARSAQCYLEYIALKLAKRLKENRPDVKKICIAGGVGLNGLMNMAILRDAGFNEVFINPASGDDGTSLGAALHVYNTVNKHPKKIVFENAFLGLDYSENEIRDTLDAYKISYTKPDMINLDIAEKLARGLIVARFTGRSEFGPRALGNRSILACPASIEIKDIINEKIKHRESFRPFAPACLMEDTFKFFDLKQSSPYMLLICEGAEGVRNKIPSVIHEDNTARVQTVSVKDNPELYEIINCYKRLSEVPVILNTSFNINGESMVETPADAVESFLFSGIDYLAIGCYMVSLKDNQGVRRASNSLELIEGRRRRYKDKTSNRQRFWVNSKPVEVELESMRIQLLQSQHIHLQLIEKENEIQRLSREIYRRNNDCILESISADPSLLLSSAKSHENLRNKFKVEISKKEQQLKEKDLLIQALINERNLGHKSGRPFPFATISDCYRFLRRKLLKIIFHSPYPLGVIRQYPPRVYVASSFIPYIKTKQKELPTICIVTPSYQQGAFLEATIRSVIDQKYPRLRYGIQDGGSTDQSIDIINKYASQLAFTESIRDAGQVDAIQRGFNKIKPGTDQIMAWLNSDDLLLPNALHYVGAYFAANPDVDVVYGHRLIINEDNFEIGRWYMPSHNCEVLKLVDYVPQETMFWRASAYKKVGGLDSSFQFAMDWDLIIRFQKANCNIVRLPVFIGCFRHHSNQKTITEINGIGNAEMDIIRKRLHQNPPSKSMISSASIVEQRRSALIYRLYKLKF